MRLQKTSSKTKRRKLAEGGLHHGADVSGGRMLSNQGSGSAAGDYVGPVCVYSAAAALANMSYCTDDNVNTGTVGRDESRGVIQGEKNLN